MPHNPNKDFLFRYDWDDVSNGYKYRLDIIPASEDDVFTDTPTIVNMKAFTLLSVKHKWHNSLDYPLGLGAAPAMDFIFNINDTARLVVDSVEVGKKFNDVIFDPISSYGNVDYYTNLDGWLGHLFTYKFTTGNIFNFYIDFGADDTESGYRLAYTGIQKKGLEFGWDPETFDFKVETLHVSRVVHESINLEYLENFKLLDAVGKGVEDEVFDGGTYYDYIGYAPAGQGTTLCAANTTKLIDTEGHYWFYEKQLVNHLYSRLYREFDSIIRRVEKSDGIFSATFFVQQMNREYKQTYDLTNNLGNQLFYSENYILAFESDTAFEDRVSYFAPILDGFLGGALLEDYKTGWDFIQEEWQSKFKNGVFIANDIKEFDVITSEEVVLDDADIEGFPDIEYGVGTLQRSEAAPAETIDADIDKSTVINASSRTEKKRNIPITLMALPTAGDYGYRPAFAGQTLKWISYPWFFATGYLRLSHVKDKAHFFNQYYRDIPSYQGNPLTNHEVMILQHEFQDFRVSDTKSYSDFFPFSGVGAPAENGAQEYNLLRQSNAGLPLQIAKTNNYVFGNADSSVITGEASFAATTNFVGSGDKYGCNWLTPTKHIKFPISSYAPPLHSTLFDNAEDNMYLTKVEVDFAAKRGQKTLVKFVGVTVKNV